MKTNNTTHGYKVKAKIITCFIILTAAVLIVLGLLQSVFLPYIYRTIKLGEMNDTVRDVISAYGTDEYYKTGRELAEKYSFAITVYNPSDQTQTKLSSTAFPGTSLYSMSSTDFAKIFAAMGDNDRITISTSDRGTTALYFTEFSFTSPDRMQSVIHARSFSDEGGVTHVVLVNAILSPMSAVSQTLSVILIIIGVFMIILALIMATYISKSIAGPIVRINNRAKMFAQGDYNVRFDENIGYREANELSATLNHAASELSKVDSMRNELIANISHDLRTPLTLISGYSEVMRDIPGEITSENLQTIIDEVARLNSLVNDLLEVSKIQSGNVSAVPESFDLNLEMQKMLNTYTTLTSRQGYNITLTCPEDVIVYADRALIVRAVMNLVNNALTYTGADRRVKITVTKCNNSNIRIEVADTGMGIAPDKLESIWDRYYKVDSEHKRAARGSGLGLSIVKSIVTMHKGSYGVRSREGAGATFWIEFPETMK